MDAFVLLGSFVLLMAIGVPIAYCLGLAALVGALWIDIPLDAVMIQLASGVNKFSLLAIPFFVLAGAIMAEGGMARRLVAFAGVLVGFIRGGLSLVNILASTFFGAISGSSVADTASIGSVLIPEMEKKGYPRPFATAVTAAPRRSKPVPVMLPGCSRGPSGSATLPAISPKSAMPTDRWLRCLRSTATPGSRRNSVRR